MRRRGILAAWGIAMALFLIGPATSAAKRKPKPHGCGAACRQLGIPQGVGGAYCGAPPWLTTASVQASATLTVPRPNINPVNPGDLLLAAIDSQTGGIVPPPGWKEVPNTEYSVGTSEHLQVFYEIPVPLSAPNKRRAESYVFKAPSSQAMTGTLTDFEDVSQTEPITAAAGQANPVASTQVTAPSITPTTPHSLLVFIGATSGAEKWTAPAGMSAPMAVPPSQPIHGPIPKFPYPPNGIGMAVGQWSSAGATGARSATITTPGSSVGDLIALNIPTPITCPKMRILNRHTSFSFAGSRQHGPLLTAGPNGLVPIRLHCDWTAPCVGAIGVFNDQLILLVAGDITIPAGQTRTLQISTCNLRSTCPARKYAQRVLNHSHAVGVAIQVIAATSNGQLIPVLRNADRMGELQIKRR